MICCLWSRAAPIAHAIQSAQSLINRGARSIGAKELVFLLRFVLLVDPATSGYHEAQMQAAG